MSIQISLRRLGLVAALGLTLAPTLAASMEHRVGDKTVTQAFPDPALAKLASAACVGDAAAIARQVAGGVDPNGNGADGVVPLFWAIHCENLSGIEALLKAGANPNYRIPGHFTLVYQAATYRDSRIHRLLLKYGGNPDTRFAPAGTEGKPAIWEAIFLGTQGDWTNYNLLLGAGLDINKPDDLGHTVATLLANQSQYDKVAELLERGYTYDLMDLALRVQISPSGDENAKRGRLRLKAMLEQRGVQFPVPEHQGPGNPDTPGRWRP